VLGGLYGPASAATPGMDLPEAVDQGEWVCKYRAAGRFRSQCRCGHLGNPSDLCSWHDEWVWRGEYHAGKLVRVRSMVRAPGHLEEFKRRMSEGCPRCLFPAKYAELQKEIERLAWDLAVEVTANGGSMKTQRAQAIIMKAEDKRRMMDEGISLGHIHKCPVTWTEIS
jgi:hypothetical protein